MSYSSNSLALSPERVMYRLPQAAHWRWTRPRTADQRWSGRRAHKGAPKLGWCWAGITTSRSPLDGAAREGGGARCLLLEPSAAQQHPEGLPLLAEGGNRS